MTSRNDATIKLTYAVDDGAFFAVDTLQNGAPFDVIANVEIGSNIMQVVDGYDVHVTVRNLSDSTTLLAKSDSQTLVPSPDPLNLEIRVDLDDAWTAKDGDVLEALTVFKARAGINSDVSVARTELFLVEA